MTAAWWCLCAGLEATASCAMTATPKRPRGMFPPISRMGGKRAYSDGVLGILGDTPRRYVMVDADQAIALWWSVVFGGWLDEVAAVIRKAPLDGEELWKAWRDEPVPADPVEALARWLGRQAPLPLRRPEVI